MKTIYAVLCLILCSFYSCSTYHRAHQWNTLIEGQWIARTKRPTEYPKIQFSRAGALFQAPNDSVFIFSCRMKNNTLILSGAHKTYRDNVILKLTKDSLIFQPFLGNTTPQVYVRIK